MQRLPALAILGLSILVASCAGSEPTEPRVATGITVVSGGAQSGVVGTALVAPVTASVTDQDGRALAGITVTFTAGATSGSFNPASATTGANGQASSAWTLGTTTGPQSASVSAAGMLATSVGATAAGGAADSIVLSTTRAIIGINPGVDESTISVAAWDAYGNVTTLPTIAWTSSAPSVATVNAGVVRGVQPGSVRISATAGAVTARIDLEVRQQSNLACVAPTMPTPGAVRGAPTFVAESAGITQQYPNAIPAVLDFNGDSRMDILLANSTWASGVSTYDGYVQAWQNGGGGMFTAANATRISGGARIAQFPMRPIIADFNGDGRADVYFAQTGFERGDCAIPGFCEGAADLFYLSQGDGTWREVSASALMPADLAAFTHTAAAADIDCDGDVDLFLGRWSNVRATAPTRLMLNQGGGTFVAATSAWLSEPPGGWAGSTFCDTDRDGDPDLIRTSTRDGVQRVYVNNGFGRFTAAAQNLPAPYFGNGSEVGPVFCIDFDQDGWMDIVTSEVIDNGRDNAVRLLRNIGANRFEDVTAARLQNARLPGGVFTIQWLSRIEVADLNGDGWPDIVGSGLHGRHLWINNGNGFTLTFGDDIDYNTITVVGDFTGDGLLDLLQSDNIADGRRGPQWILWRNTSF